MGSNTGCNFSLQDTHSNIGRIVDAVTNREPLSFVRIGDGEGHLLSLCGTSTIEDIYYFSSHFGANRVTYYELISLRDELRRACENADIVGLRDDVLNVSVEPDWFSLPPSALERKVKNHFRLRSVDMSLDSFGCRRLAFTNQSLSRLDFSPCVQFTSAWAHWDLVVSGYVYWLLRKQNHIGIITSRNALPQLIEQFFPVTTTAYFIPDSFNARPSVPAGEHFPRHFEALRNELRVEFPGMLFLVGAGLCAKVYCQWIKERGGIALDLGSVMDTWLGFGSRPAVLADRFANSPKQGNVPEDLLLNRRAIDRLLVRAESGWDSVQNLYEKEFGEQESKCRLFD